MARRSRRRMLVALAAVAAAHGAVLAWLGLFQPTLRFRPGPDPDREAVFVTLAPFPAAAPAPPLPPTARPKAVDEPVLPVVDAAPVPARIAEAEPEDPTNLARPVFRVWPHPLPPGVDWGGGPRIGCVERPGRTLPARDDDFVSEPRCLTG
jgi:hypothetical protein